MDKSQKDTNTEQRILEAAKKVFVRKGMAGARMQDIADEAGINKALLHYYFRNKEKLFEMIFTEAASKLFPRINQLFTAELPLFEKIERFCHEYIDIVKSNPYLPLFVLNEINQNPEHFLQKFWKGEHKPNPTHLLNQIAEEVQRGTIRPIHPVNLLINLVSMTIFPFMAKPMLEANLGISADQFNDFIEQRKKEIPAFIISALRP
ncbi:MAG: TetR/AcrR family transcriptional regulator [Sphingobacteriales bacterium]|jgi:AcrR family transcriptional regulator|nr:TetR/AcrR family transcriptional regulator [Sphingobacteriales bacterium]NCT76396.1 TetR/AcrR family transcriptional regulator [Chitinophagaceae bacterium]OJW33698.1 MAG: TetR family transcriptional regulator [Sphingobacteriales bacterium 46-32]